MNWDSFPNTDRQFEVIFATITKICLQSSSTYLQAENKSLSPKLERTLSRICNYHFTGTGKPVHNMVNVGWFHEFSKVQAASN